MDIAEVESWGAGIQATVNTMSGGCTQVVGPTVPVTKTLFGRRGDHRGPGGVGFAGPRLIFPPRLWVSNVQRSVFTLDIRFPSHSL